MRVFDQHKRPWSSTIELASSGYGWCSSLIPEFDTPPSGLIPPQVYLMPTNQIWRMKIDYPRWLNELTKAHEERATRIRELCVARDGQAAMAEDYKVPLDVLVYVGRVPPMAVECIRAAMAGHPWVVGTDGKKNGRFVLNPGGDGTGHWVPYVGDKPEWADKFFPKPQAKRFIEELDFMKGDDWFERQAQADLMAEPELEPEVDEEVRRFLDSDASNPDASAAGDDDALVPAGEDALPDLPPEPGAPMARAMGPGKRRGGVDVE